MQSYDKYILSTGTHWIANSGKDENGTYKNGKAGDQTGHEAELRKWYNRPWSVVLRWPDIQAALLDARMSCAMCLNDKVGYDQYQRKSYWAQLEKAGYDPSRITVACEEDCTAGVTANWKGVGHLLGIESLKALGTDTYSGNMKSRFVKAGFKALTAKKYLNSPDYLLPGDVLLYENHHAAANVTYGKYVRPADGKVPEGADVPTVPDDGGATLFTGKQLAEYCEKVYKAGWVYWYGTYGKVCSEKLYESKKKQYPEHYGSDRTAQYKKDIASGKRCADCVGMIKSFFWTGGKFDTDPKYGTNHCPDKSANGMFSLCTQTGDIKSIPDEPGLVVWKSGHIGVYVGGGYTVEMKGFNYDCKRNKVADGPWTKWGRLPESMISYDDDACGDCVIPPEPVGDRDLRNGDEGADVKQLQENLIQLGYSCGKWGADGEFGDCTEQALEAFQRDHGLNDTGVYDAKTRAAMEKALEAADEPADAARHVKIVGGNCYVRSAPDASGKKLGVAHEGDVLAYQGQTSANGWHLVDYKNQNGWVSGKYARLME